MAEIADLLLIQQKLRLCDTKLKLGHLIVNETQKIIPYDTAVFWLASSGQVEAVSNLPEPVDTSPFTSWVKSLCREIHDDKNREPRRVDPETVSEQQRNRWQEFLGPETAWCPLVTADEVIGGLFLSRREAFSPEELSLLGYWGLAAGHAVDSLVNRAQRKAHWWQRFVEDKRFFWGAVGLVVLILLIPVNLTVSAAAEVVPRKPDVVRAPITGIVGEVLVEPNQQVEAGDLILTFDDTAIRAELDVAEQELAIARAEYQRANQASVSDRRAAAQLPQLQARVEQSDARVKFNRSRLERSRIYAQSNTIAVFTDVQALVGRPVNTGEKILTLADPEEVELEFWLAVGDSIPFPPDAPVRLFLNVYPDQVHEATVRYISYQAEVSPEGILGFKGKATFNEPGERRVGWRGTARISGESVFLGYYLFRRPLSALRQWLGI